MNLIVTCSRHLEEEASNEISEILNNIGDDKPKIEITDFSGVILIDTNLDPFYVGQQIRAKILEEPWAIRYCHRFIPIEEMANTSTDEIVKLVKLQINKMNSTESYRITIEKRGCELSSEELIKNIASNIENKVSLEKYDWNIIVEIVGKRTGISILHDQDIISTTKVKRNLSE